MRTRSAASLAVGLMALALGGCGSGNSNVVAVLTQSFSPNPVIAEASSDPAFEYTASFTLTLNETAGVGATVTALSPVLYETSGGVITATVPAANTRTSITLPNNRIEGHSSLAVDFKVEYTAPNTGRVILVRITVAITDDKGVSSSGFVDVPVS